MEDLIEPLLELLHWLVKTLRRSVRGVRRQLARRRASSEPITNVLDLALSNSRRRDPPQRRGGVLRSGDLEIVISDRVLISRERQIVGGLQVGGIQGLAFYTLDDTVSLFVLTPNRPPRRILDVADLSTAEWALFAEMIAEVSYGRVVIDPLPPFPS